MSMTASLSTSAATASMNVPQTQNTAPVLEFRCLYTQDVKRKQKRWQDGRLKFHTFNKRVMVYDERSNFVGDTHWREDAEFAEGEELDLERSGTLVQVGECIGKRDQDLTELVDKRVKEKAERAAAKVASPAPSMFRNQGTPNPSHLQSRSLNTLVTPTGHYGRALLPGTSPFEERHIVNGRPKEDQDKPSKRRKLNEPTSSKNGYAQNLMGATLNLSSSRPSSTGPIRYENLKLAAAPKRPDPIDLTLDPSDDSDQGVTSNVRVFKETSKISRLQKKSRRSPPEKRGYASNLTGASLTLSRPDNFSQSWASKPVTSRAITSRKQADGSSSDDDGSSEPVAPKRPPAKPPAKAQSNTMSLSLSSSSPPQPARKGNPPVASKVAQPPTPVAQSGMIALSLSSSSPPQLRRKRNPPLASKQPQRPTLVAHTSSRAEPSSDKPMSALRIKSRSGPKMMMLMDRPSSRVSVSSEVSRANRTKSAPVQRPSKASNEIVLSQATVQLNAFCQKQEERLQARLSSKGRPVLGDLDALSSSPEPDQDPEPDEGGIDHQTIDRLLLRRSKSALSHQSEAQSKTLSVLPELTSKHESRPVRAPLRDAEQHGPKSSELSPVISLDNTPEEVAKEVSPSIPGNASVPPGAIDSSPVFSSSPTRISNHEDPAIDPGHGNEDDSGPGETMVQTILSSSHSEARRLKSPPKTFTAVPQHVLASMQAASEHFRAIIKSSSSPQDRLATVPSGPQDQQGDERAPPPAVADLETNLPNLPNLPSKTISESIQPPQNSMVSQPEETNGQYPQDDVEELPVIVPQTVQPARRILANPATRGKSVQTLAANTIDSLNNPTSNIMAPPPPRLVSRTESSTVQNAVGKGPVLQTSKEADRDSGPWSREAFDLFSSRTCERIMALRTAAAT